MPHTPYVTRAALTSPRVQTLLAASVLATFPLWSLAHDGPLEEVVSTGRAESLLGLANSASQGQVGANDLAARPLLRPGELLEVIPGSAVTQHSGVGKANQYFLRGFNLDHGTDFAGFLEGVPLNLPTHGHGQGYLDLNPIIPELVQSIEFGKGTYYADIGDFSSAGYARYHLATELAAPLLKATVGENGFYRTLAAGSVKLGDGTLLAAGEGQYYEGPWDLDSDARKANGLLRYTTHLGDNLVVFTGTAYSANWTSTDQVPQRAIDQGLISLRGNIDPTLGGESERYSLTAALTRAQGPADISVDAYFVASDFELYSNFTYLLDDPVGGDQITQRDRRWVSGFNAEYARRHDAFGRRATTRIGTQFRHDSIQDVALLRSQNRIPTSTVRDDEGRQSNIGVYVDTEIELTPWLRSTVGARFNQYWFDVDSIAANSGRSNDSNFNPKASLVIAPWEKTEFYVNAGESFHSNDGRGTVTTIDPASGDPATPVPALVNSFGAEVGVRTVALEGLQSTVSLWYLELDSELVFVGDAGSTEPNGSSKRYGVEWSNFYQVNDWLSFNLDLAFTESEFDSGDRIPGSVGRIVSSGVNIDLPRGAFGGLYMRHFGDSPLVEDGSVSADSTTIVNLRAGYRPTERIEMLVDVYNLFGSTDPDISYFFASCLPTDPAAQCGAGLSERTGVEDVHIHPVEPRQVRATFSWRF